MRQMRLWGMCLRQNKTRRVDQCIPLNRADDSPADMTQRGLHWTMTVQQAWEEMYSQCLYLEVLPAPDVTTSGQEDEEEGESMRVVGGQEEEKAGDGGEEVEGEMGQDTRHKRLQHEGPDVVRAAQGPEGGGCDARPCLMVELCMWWWCRRGGGSWLARWRRRRSGSWRGAARHRTCWTSSMPSHHHHQSQTTSCSSSR